jgi:hypothetical protein
MKSQTYSPCSSAKTQVRRRGGRRRRGRGRRLKGREKEDLKKLVKTRTRTERIPFSVQQWSSHAGHGDGGIRKTKRATTLENQQKPPIRMAQARPSPTFPGAWSAQGRRSGTCVSCIVYLDWWSSCRSGRRRCEVREQKKIQKNKSRGTTSNIITGIRTLYGVRSICVVILVNTDTLYKAT